MSEIRTEYYNTTQKKGDIKSRWWLEDDKSVHEHIFGVVDAIEKAQSWRQVRNIKYARLYANNELLGFYGTLFSRTSTMSLNTNRLALNVSKSCVDTATAKIAKNRPKPLFLTSGGNWTQKRRAEKLTKYVEGAFDTAKIYEKGPKAFVDSCVMGDGFLKFYKDKERKMVGVDRVLPDEVIVDDADGMYGEPRNLYHRKYIDRDVLCDLFPKFEKQIQSATVGVPGDALNSTTANLLKVIEGWHLPSGASSTDGRHAICVDNCTLFVEDYKKDYFPFAKLAWSPRQIGYYSSSLVEELVGIQLEINRILRNIQEAQHVMCVPRVWIENSSQVNVANINNEIGSIGKYTGTPPIINTGSAMPPEVYAHLENLYRKAFEITGISMLSATSQKPKGVDSAVAMREYQDIETERFILQGQRYENVFMDGAEIMVDMSRDMFKDGITDLKVKVKGKKFIETIDWKDVDMEDDKFIMRVFPTSLLPSSPQGRKQEVTELMQAGFIDKEAAMTLLDFPDVESFMNLQTASMDDIGMIIENMIEKGIYQSPEPFMNIQLASQMVQSAYLRGKTEAVPEDRLELLRRFMDDCNTLKNMAMQAAQPPPVAPPGAMPAADPMAIPEAAPQSELLPV